MKKRKKFKKVSFHINLLLKREYGILLLYINILQVLTFDKNDVLRYVL